MNIITLGNSFTDSLAPYFQKVVESAGEKLVFKRANFGGCELERHWSYISAEEANPVCRIYNGGQKFRDALAERAWDVVTIQQASFFSWDPSGYEPFATNIIEYIRKHAPKSEIVIQQTWVYRADEPRLMKGGAWGFGQDEMYTRLTKNYRDLAARHGLRIIPTGYGVQLSRQAEEKPFVNYDPAIVPNLRWPDLPPQAGDIVGQCFWRKNGETGEMELHRDLTHFNQRGQYMQACIWFAFLYNKPASLVKFVPDEIGNKDAAFLREIAQKAVDTFSAS